MFGSDFIHIGYDIRKWPSAGAITADQTEWEVAADLVESAKSVLGLNQNIFQFLQVASEEELERLVRHIRNGKCGSLVGFEMSKPVVSAYARRLRIPLAESVWGPYTWKPLGYDVCDCNGLFSALHMEIEEIPTTELFDEGQWREALSACQIANIVSPEHAPFALMRLSQLVTNDE